MCADDMARASPCNISDLSKIIIGAVMLLSPGAVQMGKLVTWKAATECLNVLEVVKIVMQQCSAAEVVKVKHHLAHPPSKLEHESQLDGRHEDASQQHC
jgi:hypothetical protein